MHTYNESEQTNGISTHGVATEDRRARVRFPTDDAAWMKVVQPSGAMGAEVRVLDVSQSGLKLRVPANLLPGTIVQIDLEGVVMLAEVRYCVRAELGFHAGVQLQNVAWTSDATS
jgi:hypothetical protein